MSQFDLNSLPIELFPYVLKKLPANEIVRLLKTCHYVHDIGRRCRHLTRLSIPFISTHTQIDETKSLQFTPRNTKTVILKRSDTDRLRDFAMFSIQTDELSIMGSVTSDYLRDWIPILGQLKITCDKLEIYAAACLSCTAGELKQLIQTVKPSSIYCSEIIRRQVFPPVVFDKVLDVRMTSNYSNEDLLLMKQPHLKISSPSIDSFGLNRFLKQWYNNEREIENVTISSMRPLVIDRIVSNLPLSVLYTPEYHGDSLLRPLEPNANRESLFVMMKSDNLSGLYVVKVDYNSLIIEKTNNPTAYLTTKLSCPEYELVTGRCKACDFPMIFCFHHRSLASLLTYTFE